MSVDERLLEIERRLAALEARFRAGLPPVVSAAPPPSGAPPPVAAAGPPSAPQAPAPAPAGRTPSGAGVSVSLVLGWTGAAALVLAAAYLVRLGIESGWLTPPRQLAGAALLGLSMLAGGVMLRSADRRYSSLLGAAGVAVLYLTVFGAHLHHHLIGPLVATALAVAIAALSLLLHALFREPLYVAFALLGSYACPLLVPSVGGGPLDLAIYLTVWNAVYCAYALWIARRIVYVAALYASLLIFDALWRGPFGGESWSVAAAFQLVQFLLFLSAIALFSVRARRSLSPVEAWAHFPALLLFYGVEYAILDQHAPAAAPAAAAGFAAFLYAAYAAVRTRLRGETLPSLTLVNAFGALVLFHAVHLEAMSRFGWRPLVALLAAGALAAAARARPGLGRAFWPYGVAGALLFAAGYLELVWEWGDGDNPLEVPLALLYPLALYVAYGRWPPTASLLRRPLILILAHAQLLIACGLLVYRIVPDDSTAGRLWLSLAWAATGTLALVAAGLRRDTLLARSSLGIYALFAAKVLLFDLSGAAPLVRVGCLAVLGISLYAGGWIYRRVLGPGLEVAAVSRTGS